MACYNRRQVKSLAESPNLTGNTTSNIVDNSNTQHVSSNHCEDWNPNQIVYNKVR